MIRWIINLYMMTISLSLFSINSFAGVDDFYHQHRSGWHWYKEIKSTNKLKKEVTQQEHAEKINHELATVQETFETARKEMVLHPTEQNVLRFILLQQQLTHQADLVSTAWKKVLLNYPELDFNLVNPGNSTARAIVADVNTKKEDDAIKLLGKKSGLFFFYRSTCPFCKGFAPTVKTFAELYHINVIPITTDGISLPEFPNSYIDQGQAATFNVKAEPALFAVNPYTKKAFPVAYGLISLTDLRRKILGISQQLMTPLKEKLQ